MYNNPPNGFEVFRPIINEHLRLNKDKIFNFCEKRKHIKGQVNSPQIYCFNKNIDYKNIISELNKLYSDLSTPNYDALLTIILDKINSSENSIINYRNLIKSLNSEFTENNLDIDSILSIIEMRGLISRNPRGQISLS